MLTESQADERGKPDSLSSQMEMVKRRILALAEERGLAPTVLSEQAGLQRGFLSDLIIGKKSSITLDALVALARALNVEPASLLQSVETAVNKSEPAASSDSGSGPRPRAGVLDIAAYVPGDERSPAARVFKLSSNETPLGPSPQAVEAYRQAADRLEAYPDGAATKLREAIGRAHGLNPERIVCGAGSDELLSLLANAYLSPGDEGLYSAHGFLVYRIAILGAGATPVVAAERNETADVDALLASVTPRTKIVFLANPNNPTGTYLPFTEVRRLHAGLAPDVLLVLDAAYAEYVRKNDYESGVALAAESSNVVMTRTFSKIYGLAGLRLGWMFGPTAIIDAVNRIRGPFNVNAPAIAAGVAALEDRTHLERAVAHNLRWLDWTKGELEGLGLRVTPSAGNFLLVHFPPEPGRTAAEADKALRDAGYVLRRVAGYGFPDALRLTIGTEEAMRGVVDTLARFLRKG